MAVGGISVTTERQKKAFFSTAYMVNGKAPIARCADVGKYQTVADIDKPSTRVIFNPGGSNERFARANFKQAQMRLNPEKPLQYGEKWPTCCRAGMSPSKPMSTSGCTWPKPAATTSAWKANG